MVCPKKIMADSETQDFEWLNFFKRNVKRADWRVCHTVLLEIKRGESVRFVRNEIHIPSV